MTSKQYETLKSHGLEVADKGLLVNLKRITGGRSVPILVAGVKNLTIEVLWNIMERLGRFVLKNAVACFREVGIKAVLHGETNSDGAIEIHLHGIACDSVALQAKFRKLLVGAAAYDAVGFTPLSVREVDVADAGDASSPISAGRVDTTVTSKSFIFCAEKMLQYADNHGRFHFGDYRHNYCNALNKFWRNEPLQMGDYLVNVGTLSRIAAKFGIKESVLRRPSHTDKAFINEFCREDFIAALLSMPTTKGCGLMALLIRIFVLVFVSDKQDLEQRVKCV